ncbi:type II secretion system protein [Macrococcus carouselicus]|uniref:type II secretion system protein n=1 Tax=Macrococcus carouselicus TaxID=69969 RepID=UPI001408230A|nr:type II secretion system protein [Macrococcus carouselicus]
MKADKGFLLIDSMLSLAITSIICLALLPMMQKMGQNYEDSYNELQQYREFYVYIRGGGAVHEDEHSICSPVYCIKKK